MNKKHTDGNRRKCLFSITFKIDRLATSRSVFSGSIGEDFSFQIKSDGKDTPFSIMHYFCLGPVSKIDLPMVVMSLDFFDPREM